MTNVRHNNDEVYIYMAAADILRKSSDIKMSQITVDLYFITSLHLQQYVDE